MARMYFHASSGCLLAAVMPRPIEPLTADASSLPATPGPGTMPTLPAILDSFGSLARLNMYVQLRAKAACPLENTRRTSSSRYSLEFGLVTPSSTLLTMYLSASTPPPDWQAGLPVARGEVAPVG